MKKLKFIYSIIVLSLFSMIAFIGCQQEETFDKLYDKEAYLSFSPNVNYDQLSEVDLSILSQAFGRLNIRENEDGLFEIAQNRGKDINISEELFNYFLLIAEGTNEKILSEVHFTRNSVQTRQEEGGSNTDCVAHSIAYATGQSYESVNSWITGQYGSGGVPSSQFYSTMNHFNNGAQVPFSMFNSMDISTIKKYIIVIDLGHAVTIVNKTGDNIMYWDAQNREYNYCTTSRVTHIYELR